MELSSWIEHRIPSAWVLFSGILKDALQPQQRVLKQRPARTPRPARIASAAPLKLEPSNGFLGYYQADMLEELILAGSMTSIRPNVSGRERNIEEARGR